MKFVAEDVHKILLSDRNFRENRFGEIHTLRRGVSEFLSLLSTFITRLV
jgi:hypothetical protein